MNKRLSPRESPISSSLQLLEHSLPLSKLLDLAQVDRPIDLQPNPLLKVAEFQLGEEIASSANLYWLCQGRVRLLCQPIDRAKEVTALLLESEGTFGADSLFTDLLTPLLPYRAIAATPVQLASISTDELAPLLNHFPQLRSYLLRQVQQRDRLIFLKLFTALRLLPSRQLKQIEPYWREQIITAGTILSDVAPADVGRFWLRQGEICASASSSASSSAFSSAASPDPLSPISLPAIAPAIGESWGYPDPTPKDWVAQTDLKVYHLPIAAWESIRTVIPNATEGIVGAPVSQNGAYPDNRTPFRVLEGHVAAKSHQPSLAPGAQSRQTQNELTVKNGAVKNGAVKNGAVKNGAVKNPVAKLVSSQSIAFPKPVQRRLLDVLHRYPWIEQQSSSDCGAACLGMVSRYWGKSFPINMLRERAGVGRSGASLKSLAAAAEGLGFHSRPVRASLGRLADQANPWIAHWQGNHYVVVYQVQGNRVTIADPALGRRSLSRSAFQNHWTGYALLLDPSNRLQETKIQKTSLTRYLGALVPYRSLILQVIFVSLLIQLVGLVTPLFTQIILDRVVVQKSLNTLNVFVLGLLIFGAWSICMVAVRQYLLSHLANRLDLTLISGFIRHTLTLPLKFFESRRVGDIVTRVQENQKIQRFLVEQVVIAWLSFVTGFVYLGLMIYYNWHLTLLVLALIPPIVILTLIATPFMRRVSREVFNETANQNSALVELITGIATVKASASEQELRWRWEDDLTRQMNAIFRGQKLSIGLQSTGGFIQSLGSSVLLWYGATLVIQDQLTIGQFIAFNMMMGYVISPVLALVGLWDELQEVLISVERLNDVFDTESEDAAQRSLLILPTIEGRVQFEDVTFRYSEDEEQNTIQNLSFTVQPGQTIAIVGRSGSGKTTLVKLLQGLYHPNRGRVLVDGHDLCHVTSQSLRSQLGVVPQECFLFSGSILENITLYRSEFTLEQAIEVAKLAEAHAFIQSMPLGYSTMVGERGSSLSGGQRQRIAIARAILGNPRILILDEATSSLDTESERRFQRNLMQISQNCTMFIIAHRLSTVRNADRILVLDRGVLVEQGSHAELMEKRSLYCHLAQQQLDL